MEFSKKFFLEEEIFWVMNNFYDIVFIKVRIEIEEDDEMDILIIIEEKMEIDRIRMEKRGSEKENEVSKKIIKFMWRFIFCLKV